MGLRCLTNEQRDLAGRWYPRVKSRSRTWWIGRGEYDGVYDAMIDGLMVAAVTFRPLEGYGDKGFTTWLDKCLCSKKSNYLRSKSRSSSARLRNRTEVLEPLIMATLSDEQHLRESDKKNHNSNHAG